MPDHARITLEVFSDLRCPFCYLEEPELDVLKAHFGDDLKIRWRPLELRPEPEPALDPHGDYLNQLWQDAVLPMAAERGLTMLQPNHQPRSRCALEAVCWVQRQYGDQAAERFRLALFRGFFEHSLDLADHHALAAHADQFGLDGAALAASLAAGEDTEHVRNERQAAAALDIRGVPTLRFMIDGEHAGVLVGAQPRRQLLLAVERLLDLLRQQGNETNR